MAFGGRGGEDAAVFVVEGDVAAWAQGAALAEVDGGAEGGLDEDGCGGGVAMQVAVLFQDLPGRADAGGVMKAGWDAGWRRDHGGWG